MALESILNTMASAMSAQSIRMNISASNLANAASMGSSEDTTYRSKHPVFQEVQQKISGLSDTDQPVGGVRVTDIVQGNKKLDSHYDPDNPLADKDGRVYLTDVDPIAEMTDMMSASKEYQANVEVVNTIKSLLLKTIHAMNN